MAIPIGTVVCYSLTQVGQSSQIGESWLPCDGSDYARNKYSDLFNIIGGAFGTDGTTNFYLPDLRGQFVRSQDDGKGWDPDAATRTAMATNGNVGIKLAACNRTVSPFTSIRWRTPGAHIPPA